MALESRFLGVLKTVERWTVQRGRLVLSAPDGQTIEARRAARAR
jgi:heat shock protein HslJ